MQNEVLLFAGNSNRPLAEKISEYLDTSLGSATVGKFSDGETRVTIEESVRGKRIFLLQSTSAPTNDNLMELLIMVDALKRASALSVTAVVPYYGYARQDRKARARDPITAKLVANLMTVSGIDRLVSIDMHVSQLQGFFDIPVDHLQAFPVFVDYLKKKYKDEISNFTVVSPDVGGVKRARKFAGKLDVPLAILDKRRPKDNVAEIVNIIGEVKGRDIILVDDIIDTGGSVSKGAKFLKNAGAKRIVICVTHGVFSGNAFENLSDDAIDSIIVTDTIHHENLPEKITELSVAPLFGETILRIYKNMSVSVLFR